MYYVVGSLLLKTNLLICVCYDLGVTHAVEVVCPPQLFGKHTEFFKVVRESQTIASFLPHTTLMLSLTPAGMAETPK